MARMSEVDDDAVRVFERENILRTAASRSSMSWAESAPAERWMPRSSAAASGEQTTGAEQRRGHPPIKDLFNH